MSFEAGCPAIPWTNIRDGLERPNPSESILALWYALHSQIRSPQSVILEFRPILSWDKLPACHYCPWDKLPACHFCPWDKLPACHFCPKSKQGVCSHSETHQFSGLSTAVHYAPLHAPYAPINTSRYLSGLNSALKTDSHPLRSCRNGAPLGPAYKQFRVEN